MDLLLSPPIAFMVLVLVSLGVYFLGYLMGEKPKAAAGKLEPYACGENFIAEKFEFGYRKFFVAAIFFTIMHVATLTIATVPGGIASYRALVYLGVIAASVYILY